MVRPHLRRRRGAHGAGRQQGNAMMMEWDDRLLTGNARIDFEHKIFLDLLRHFSEARAARATSERLLRILEEVALYARFHFRSEENLMQDAGYPDLVEHREQHRRLVNELSNNLAGLEIQLYQAERVEQFLASWFIDHVTIDDVRVGRHLAATAG
jgi:hemerythrin